MEIAILFKKCYTIREVLRNRIKGKRMTQNQKKKPYLKLVKPLNLEEIKKKTTLYRKSQIKKWGKRILLVTMAISGTWMMVTTHDYTRAYQTASFKRDAVDNSDYVPFENGMIRYTRDGVMFLNNKNKEQWIQPSQFKNPVIDLADHTFAIADIGGNAIQVFTKEGIKGEIETNLPIEKFTVSDHGIVSAILKNEFSPMVVTYDAVGNVLVENQVSTSESGYPIALEMSPNGKNLLVSYLTSQGNTLKSKVVSYNFGDAGKEKKNHQVGMDEYEDSIVPEIYYMNASTAVAVGDHSFAIYEGKTAPEKKKEVQIGQDIKSSFHTDQYIGFVLLNKEKSGYEVRLYNKYGKQIMNREFSGEYSHVQMVGDEIILYEGTSCCIITKTGIPRFKGDLKVDIKAIVPATGMNKYLVMSTNELRVVYLAY